MSGTKVMTRWMTVCAFIIAVSLVLSVPGAYGQAKKALVDLNTASQKDLEEIKGVGPSTSKKIIAARPYKSVDELKKAGLSAKQIDSIRPYVMVGAVPAGAPATAAPMAKPAPAPASPASPAAPAAPAPAKAAKAPAAENATTAKLAPGEKVNINSAPKEKLDALPGIGPVKAQAIIDGRPYAKPEDVMKVKGIKQGEYSKIKDLITVK